MTRLSALGNPQTAAVGITPTPTSAPMILPYAPDANLCLKIQKAWKLSRKKLAVARKMRYMLLREYVGRHYFGMMAEQSKAEPLNFFFRTVWSIVPAIVPDNQEVSVITQSVVLKQFAGIFGLAVNHLSKRTNRIQTLRGLVVDAIFAVGIAKQGLTFGKEVEIDGFTHDVGQPFCDPVSFDNYFVDPQARAREEAWLEGDRTLMPLEYVRSCGLYQNTDKLRAFCTSKEEHGRQAKDLGKGEADQYELDELVPQVEMLDCYIPQENLMVTLPIEETQGTDPLRIVEWEGPRRGPYDTLYFHLVPDNLMGIAPASIWYDLHVMINEEARRMKREAQRRKTVLAYTPAAEDDAEAIKTAADGEGVKVQNIDALKEFNWGGAAKEGYEHMAYLKGMFSYISGNADLVGGLGTPNSDTATEASILQGNSQVGVNDMRTQVSNFAKRLYEKDAWYLWSDPLMNMPLARRLPTGQEVQVFFSTDAREGDFLDYEFEIVTNAAETMDPTIRVKRMQDLVMGIVLPGAQMAAMVGDIPNIKQIVKDLGEVLGVKGIEQWYVSKNPGMPSPQDQMLNQLDPGKGVPMPGLNPANPDNPQFTDPSMMTAGAANRPASELNNSGGGY